MALPNSIRDLEKQKFLETTGGNVAVRVVNDDATGLNADVNLTQVGSVDVPVDDAAFTPGTTPVQPVGFFADETATDSVDEGDTGSARMTLDRKQLTASEFKEDAAHTDADYGTHMLSVRDDAPVAKAGADGDYQSLTTDDTGALWQRSRAYDTSEGADKNFRTNADWGQHVEETLIDETNITTNTTTYAYLDMDGYRFFSLQGETSGTTPTDVLTVTIEATNQDDGTAAASCTYQDVTNELFGVANWVDTDFFAINDTSVAFKYMRVKYVTSNGAGNDADLTVYAKRMY